MASILIDWGTKIAAKLGELALGEARYLICFKCIAEEFEKEKKKLIVKKNSVEEDVADARNRAENIRYEVDTWLKEADKYIKEEPEKKSHEEEDTKKKITFLHRKCPKCFRLYLRGKELDEMKLEISEMRKQNFEKVGRVAKVPSVEFYAPQNFIELKSRTSAYKQVLKALKDGNDYIVGLHGLGGTGKTTLAKKVGLELKQQKAFDEVVFTTVSNDPNIKKIQDEIAGSLGLQWKDETEIDRPKKLWLRLTKGGKILIILDDVWKKLDFDAIGIPFNSKEQCCKVLLTSRDAEVCSLMECEKLITLNRLDDDDAQILFENLAGISNKFPKEFKDKGKEIAKACKGLPVAVATIASTLKGRPLKVWKAALTALKSIGDTDEFIEIYKRLKVSYDHLNNDEAKKLLLLCSLFPEDYEIPEEDFIRFGIGLGLFGDVHSYKATRIHVDKAGRKLIDSCLLLEGEEGHVKMHDLVRDAAHWIANQENQFGVLDMVPGRNVAEKHNTNEMRYLYCRGIFINDQLDWAKLEILILVVIDEDFVEEQEAFFGRMKNLRVLALDNGDQWDRLNIPLPQSFESLKFLRTLRLTNFELNNIAVVELLKSLEILEFKDCLIDELSIGIVRLGNLRLLSMVDCKFQQNPYKVIGQLSGIQELYFKNIYKIGSGETWDLDKGAVANLFGKGNISMTLQRYYIEVRDGSRSYGWTFDHSISRALAIQYFDPDASNTAIKDLVCRAECLDLLQIQGEYKAIIPDIIEAIGGEMKDLTSFTLYSCSKIEYLIDATRTHSLSTAKTVFSKLDELFFYNMDALRTLCYSSHPQELSFDRLKRVHVKCCPLLTSVFTFSIAHSLAALEELVIEKCGELKCIIIDEQSRKEKKVKHGPVQMFQKLKALEIRDCDQIEFIFPVFSATDLQQLEAINISSCGELKYIFGQCQLDDHVSHPNEKEIILPSLETMDLDEVPNFVNVLPKCCHPNLSSLSTDKSTLRKDLVAEHQASHKHYSFPWIHMCCFSHTYEPKSRRSSKNQESLNVSKVEHLDFTVSSGLQTSNSGCVCPSDTTQCVLGQSLMLRNVKSMGLTNCGKIESLFALSTSSTMLVEQLTIEACHGLSYIITDMGDSHDRVDIFPNLKELIVKDCSNLKYIVEQHSINVLINLLALEDLDLCNLPTMVGICPTNYCARCPSLNSLSVNNCPEFAIKSLSDFMLGLDAIELDRTATEASYSKCLLRQSLMLRNVKIMTLSNWGTTESLFTLSTASTMLVEQLTIEKCHELKYIITDIGDNHDRISIFPKLKLLKVDACSKLECVVGRYHCERPNDDTDTRIDFPALEELSFWDLPNMVNISTINYYATYPSLNTLSVINCSELAVKSISDFMVGLDERYLDRTPTKGIERIVKHLETLDFLYLENLKIEGIFCVEEPSIKDARTVTSRATELGLKDLAGLKYIWNGPKHFLALTNLKELKIEGCGELEVIFSVSIMRTIPQLKVLMIRNCPKLEKIIEEDEENPVPQQVCFPELKVLVIKDCNKLEHVLSMSTPNEFPKLDVMMIEEASQLKQVFKGKIEGEGEIEEEAKQVVLPKLKCVILVQLPNLANVCGGFQLERVEYQYVRDCNSNITPTSSIALLRSFRDKYLDYFKDPMQLGWELCSVLHGLIDRIIENPTTESTIVPSQTAIENLNSEIIEAATESEQSSSQKQKDEHLISEPSLKDQQQAYGERENTMKIPQEIHSIEKTEEQSLREYSKSDATENVSIKKTKEQSYKEYSKSKEVDHMASSSTTLQTESVQSSPSFNRVHKEELVDKQSMREPSSKDQQEALEKTNNSLDNFEATNSNEAMEEGNLQSGPELIEELVVENVPTKANHVVTSTLLETEGAQLRFSITLTNKSSQTEQAYIHKNSEVDPKDLQDYKDENIIQSMKEDGSAHAHEPMPPVSLIAEKHIAEDNLVGKALGDLEVFLKMHLKDIASSESYSMCLQVSLNFLSRLSIGDGVLSLELKSLIDSLQHEFSGILSSFKESFAVVKTFADLEEREKFIKDKLTLQTREKFALASKISEICKHKDEAQNKKTILENKISRLQVELEFENVKKDKSLLVDTERKARQKLLQTEYKWSILCTQFERSLGAHMASTSDFHLHKTANLHDKSGVSESETYATNHSSSLYHNVEEDIISAGMPTVPVIATEDLVNKENLVSRILADLEVFMKMPLKDIATSEDNSLRLYTALNFLSHLSCEDEALSNVLKSIINALYQDFPSILCSFKEAFAMIKKISELEEGEEPIEEGLARQKKAISLGSVYHNMDEAIQKEANLREQITRLQVELESVKEAIKDCEAGLPSLQGQKNKCVAEIKFLEMEFESAKKNKYLMAEDQRKAQQVLIHIDYKWRVLCSRFEMNRIAARNA